MAQSMPYQHFINIIQGDTTRFDPEVTYANIGDIVVFNFSAPNQAVIRGEYAKSPACGRTGCDPCIPYESIHVDADLDERLCLQSEPNVTPGSPFQGTYIHKVEDSDSWWFYSGIQDECASKGVVGVVNPDTGTSIDIQRRAALAGSVQAGVDHPTIINNGTTVQPSANSSSTAHAMTSQLPRNGVPHSTLAGIIIGAIALLLAGVATVYLIRSFLQRRREQAKQAFEPAKPRIVSPPPVLTCRAPSSVYTTRFSAFMHAPISPISSRSNQDDEGRLSEQRTKSYTNLATNPYEPQFSPRLPQHPAFRRDAWL